MSVNLRRTTAADADWVRAFTKKFWGAEFFLIHRVLYYPHELPGWIAETEMGEKIGLGAWFIKKDACELVMLAVDPPLQHQGIGTRLLNMVIAEATNADCRRLWLVTTNDQLSALRFYQRRDFRLVSLERGAMDKERAVKRTIPEVGEFGIPVHDELELEKILPKNETLRREES